MAVWQLNKSPMGELVNCQTSPIGCFAVQSHTVPCPKPGGVVDGNTVLPNKSGVPHTRVKLLWNVHFTIGRFLR